MKVNTISSINFSAFTLFIFILLSISACDPVESGINSNTFDYGTKSDSARFYYLNGFHEILDNGRWTESEKSFRKALEFDPDYILGKSLVGRITRELKEREILLQELQAVRDSVSSDEKLLLDVYLLSIESYNNRDKGIEATSEFNAKRRQISESNFRKFVHKYPEDDYVKAEYIEVLHFYHGPEAALDSLKSLATEKQMKSGFYISSSASLELELGNIEKAVALSKDLEELMTDSTYTSYMKLKAEIYMAQDSLYKAKEYIDQVVEIDPNHIIALGMQSAINKELNN